MIHTEMVRRSVSHKCFSEQLALLGAHDSPVKLRNKMSRGEFTVVYTLLCMEPQECKSSVLDAEV